MPALYPLPSALFPTVKVHADHVAQCASTSERILESTIAARQEYVHRYNRQLDPATWRLVRRRRRSEDGVDMSVFQPQHKVRVPRPATTLSCSPILIAAGSMDGTLDDVMLGLTASTTSTMKLVTSSLHDGIPDARVLNRMDTPTPDDPFAFLGLKWFVRKSTSRLAALARPRDFVYLDASGIRTLPSGTRVGYQLMHSVDLPQCPPMPMSLNIVRAYMSFCFLFYENPTTKRVEMFCKGYVDPRGGLARRITVSVAADMILGCSNALQCARRKKIEWMLEEGAARETQTATDVEVGRRYRECVRPSGSSKRPKRQQHDFQRDPEHLERRFPRRSAPGRLLAPPSPTAASSASTTKLCDGRLAIVDHCDRRPVVSDLCRAGVWSVRSTRGASATRGRALSAGVLPLRRGRRSHGRSGICASNHLAVAPVSAAAPVPDVQWWRCW
ncbi:hypothetical protein PINS_up006638 [Pythium insidiosum]|nr:hypothetical protein PINS_up006638 [Pythium insidiosum]